MRPKRTTIRPDELHRSPNALAGHYSRFRVGERLLLSGHSHQAWPDAGFEGQKQAWLDAADFVDDKWESAFERADRCREGWARLMGDPPGHIALAASTHDLVVRWLSALPLRDRPRIVTTTGEFHSIRRQLDRLEEEGLVVDRIARDPVETLVERLAEHVDRRTAAVLISAVFYEDAMIVPHLGRLMRVCRDAGAELLIDAYHAFNVVPFSLAATGLEDAFVLGGGYKYCQLGEGNCAMYFPRGRELRPVVTGWFSEFEALSAPKGGGGIGYPRGPALFDGATYDPSSHYRAAAVFDFFQEMGLTPELLREVSQHQVRLLADAFDALDADPAVITRERETPLERIGGFLSLRAPSAGEIRTRLLDRGVFTDHRGDRLRLGPAPYLSDAQLDEAIGILGEVVEE